MAYRKKQEDPYYNPEGYYYEYPPRQPAYVWRIQNVRFSAIIYWRRGMITPAVNSFIKL